MSPIIAGYIIVLLAGGVRTEVRTAIPLSLEQCHRLGDGWVARGSGYKYECHKIPNINTGAKPMRGSEIDIITGVRPQVLNTPIQAGDPAFVWYYWDGSGKAHGPFHSKAAAIKSIEEQKKLCSLTQEN